MVHKKEHSAIVRKLFNTHSPWLPAHFTCFPGLPHSRVLLYRLSTLPENISTFEAQTCRGCREKRWTQICGQTRTRTHTQTHTHTHTQTKCNKPRRAWLIIVVTGAPEETCSSSRWRFLKKRTVLSPRLGISATF